MLSFKKTAAAGLMTLMCVAGYAEGLYLHIQTPDGWKILDLEKVDRLTFSNGVMTASDKDRNTVGTYRQEELQTMYVDNNEQTGIASVEAEKAAAFIYSAESRTVTFLADGPFSIYGIDGVEIHTIPAVAKGETVSLEGLRAGIVILKSGEYTLKAVVK